MTRHGTVLPAAIGPSGLIGLVHRAITVTVATTTIATTGASKEMQRNGNGSPPAFRFAFGLVDTTGFVSAASAMVFDKNRSTLRFDSAMTSWDSRLA
ncbi:MAG TPA: hypothetical protein VKG25_10415, partial [Bryobacteraceae bacterium]|nr:hypothetical protein [Bryobacteraceae bacterium]